MGRTELVWFQSTGLLTTETVEHASDAYRGAVVNRPMPKPAFTLTDTSGRAFDFRAKTDGFVTLLFFGYTNCGDICPMQMSHLADALHKLPKETASQFKVVFVSTDPERDSAQAIRSWLDHFDKAFVGLLGSKSEIAAAQRAANVPVAKGAPNYEHSTFVIPYTRDNLAHVVYRAGVSQGDWLQDLPRLAIETWPHH